MCLASARLVEPASGHPRGSHRVTIYFEESPLGHLGRTQEARQTSVEVPRRLCPTDRGTTSPPDAARLVRAAIERRLAAVTRALADSPARPARQFKALSATVGRAAR